MHSAAISNCPGLLLLFKHFFYFPRELFLTLTEWLCLLLRNLHVQIFIVSHTCIGFFVGTVLWFRLVPLHCKRNYFVRIFIMITNYSWLSKGTLRKGTCLVLSCSKHSWSNSRGRDVSNVKRPGWNMFPCGSGKVTFWPEWKAVINACLMQE